MLEAAVRKMTGQPADRCRLAGRGYLRPGYAAELVIFATGSVQDRATFAVQDRATFAASNQLPAGIDRVLANGVEVVSEGAWNGRAAGRMLSRGEPG